MYVSVAKMILEEDPATLCCGYTKGQIVPGGLITVANPLEGPQGPLIFGPKWVKHAEGEVAKARDGPYLSSRSGSDTPGNQGRVIRY